MIRSEKRIPKLRTRGRENRRRLLEEALRLLAKNDGEPLKFSDVFEAAGVSRGSAYRIYLGIDDLLQDLATEWINNFVAHLESEEPASPPENWAQLSDFIVKRAGEYWKETQDTMRVLPRIRSNAPSSHNQAIRALAECTALLFDRYFVIPEIPHWLSKIAFYTQIGDICFSDAVRTKGEISERRLKEAQTLCRTYLAFYLPSWLPPRNSSEHD